MTTNSELISDARYLASTLEHDIPYDGRIARILNDLAGALQECDTKREEYLNNGNRAWGEVRRLQDKLEQIAVYKPGDEDANSYDCGYVDGWNAAADIAYGTLHPDGGN